MSNILVFGALLQDITFLVEDWPSPGEVVFVHESQKRTLSPGGKALNQAVAAARLGATVEVVGCIGNDILGDGLITALKKENVGVQFVTKHPDKSTGLIGIIESIEHRENPSFIADPGASLQLTDSDINNAANLITANTVVMVDYELLQPSVATILKIAKEKGATTVLNPAPPRIVDRNNKYWTMVDYLIPNEAEARTITGEKGMHLSDLADALLELGVGASCITLGEHGCYYSSVNENFHSEAISIDLLGDAVGASDAFCAAFAIGLLEKMGTENLLRFANAAGATACTKSGGLPSMPYRKDVEKLLQK